MDIELKTIKKKKPNKQAYYVNNKEMLEEFKKYRKTGKISEELGGMFLDIAKNILLKPNFIGYTWKEDMACGAVLTCVKYSKNFDPEKGSNPYGYISRICFNYYKEYIKKQKRHSGIKETLYNNKDLVDQDHFYAYKSVDYTTLRDNIT